MQLYHVENYSMLDEHEYVDGEYAVYVYNDVGGADSKKNLKQGFNTKYGQVKPMEEMNEQKQKAFSFWLGSMRTFGEVARGKYKEEPESFLLPDNGETPESYWAKITGGESPTAERRRR